MSENKENLCMGKKIQPSPSADIQFLSQQIDRLNKVIEQKDRQLAEANLIISQYHSEQIRSKENLCLIVLLFAEIQTLRNRIQQLQTKRYQQNLILVENLKGLKKKGKNLGEVNDCPNFSILKELQHCLSRLQLQRVNLDNQITKNQHQILDPNQKQQTLIYPNSSLTSSKSLSSNNSIIQEIIPYYQRQNPITSIESIQSNQDSLYRPINRQRPGVLATFGKIIESKNIQSDEGSLSSLQQSKVITPQHDQNISDVPFKNRSFLLHRNKNPLVSSINFLNKQTS